jgi:hypothetical protein
VHELLSNGFPAESQSLPVHSEQLAFDCNFRDFRVLKDGDGTKDNSNALNPNGRRLHLITSLRRGMNIAQSVSRRVSEIYSLLRRAKFLHHVVSARNAERITLLQRDFVLQVGGLTEESSL